MPGRLAILISALLAGLLLAGCGTGEVGLTAGSEAALPQQPAQTHPGNRDIEPTGPLTTGPPPPIRQSFAGSQVLSEGQNLRYSSYEPLFQVITTQGTLDSFWQTYLPQGPTAPQVDFARSFVLAGIQGVKSTGGYAISFTGLEQDGQELRVTTEWIEPVCDEPASMSFTQPYTVLRVDSAMLTEKGALVFVFETERGKQLGRVAAIIP